MPVYVRQSSSLTSFKRQINLLDLGKYLKGSATDINQLYGVGHLFGCHVS